jgi:hypothetical protein
LLLQELLLLRELLLLLLLLLLLVVVVVGVVVVVVVVVVLLLLPPRELHLHRPRLCGQQTFAFSRSCDSDAAHRQDCGAGGDPMVGGLRAGIGSLDDNDTVMVHDVHAQFVFSELTLTKNQGRRRCACGRRRASVVLHSLRAGCSKWLSSQLFNCNRAAAGRLGLRTLPVGAHG